MQTIWVSCLVCAARPSRPEPFVEQTGLEPRPASATPDFRVLEVLSATGPVAGPIHWSQLRAHAMIDHRSAVDGCARKALAKRSITDTGATPV